MLDQNQRAEELERYESPVTRRSVVKRGEDHLSRLGRESDQLGQGICKVDL